MPSGLPSLGQGHCIASMDHRKPCCNTCIRVQNHVERTFEAESSLEGTALCQDTDRGAVLDHCDLHNPSISATEMILPYQHGTRELFEFQWDHPSISQDACSQSEPRLASTFAARVSSDTFGMDTHSLEPAIASDEYGFSGFATNDHTSQRQYFMSGNEADVHFMADRIQFGMPSDIVQHSTTPMLTSLNELCMPSSQLNDLNFGPDRPMHELSQQVHPETLVQAIPALRLLTTSPDLPVSVPPKPVLTNLQRGPLWVPPLISEQLITSAQTEHCSNSKGDFSTSDDGHKCWSSSGSDAVGTSDTSSHPCSDLLSNNNPALHPAPMHSSRHIPNTKTLRTYQEGAELCSAYHLYSAVHPRTDTSIPSDMVITNPREESVDVRR